MTGIEPDFVQPHGAPGQKSRVMDYLREHPEGLTQLVALQQLAVSRLAAIVFRLKEDDGQPIVTDMVDMETRYGVAKVAKYRLAKPDLVAARAAHRTPVGILDKHCQSGRGDVCRASQRDGIVCPPDSCDIDDGVRKPDPPGQYRPLDGANPVSTVHAPIPKTTPEDVDRLRRELFE